MMSQSLATAQQKLLFASGLDDNSLSKALAMLTRGNRCYDDLYFQSARSRPWPLPVF